MPVVKQLPTTTRTQGHSLPLVSSLHHHLRVAKVATKTCMTSVSMRSTSCGLSKTDERTRSDAKLILARLGLWSDMQAGQGPKRVPPKSCQGFAVFDNTSHIHAQVPSHLPNYLRSSSKLVGSCLVMAALVPKYATKKLP